MRVGLGSAGLFRVGFALVRVGFKASSEWDLGLCRKGLEAGQDFVEVGLGLVWDGKGKFMA